MSLTLSRDESGWSGLIRTKDEKTVQVIKTPNMEDACLVVETPDERKLILALLDKRAAKTLVSLLLHYLNETEPEG